MTDLVVIHLVQYNESFSFNNLAYSSKLSPSVIVHMLENFLVAKKLCFTNNRDINRKES